MKSLENTDSYITKSDYKNCYNFFFALDKSEMLKGFCSKNKIDPSVVSKFIKNYVNFDDLIQNINNQFVDRHLENEKSYLDTILKSYDPNIILDDEQRRVVLNDEDYILAIAGAGSGKTTTVAAKVKYLVDKKHIDPKQILVISFTNKAVSELRERINKDLNIDCLISTFHSAGLDILRKNSSEKKGVAPDGVLYKSILNTLKVKLVKKIL